METPEKSKGTSLFPGPMRVLNQRELRGPLCEKKKLTQTLRFLVVRLFCHSWFGFNFARGLRMSSYSKASSSLLSFFAASVSRGSSCNLAGSIERHGALRFNYYPQTATWLDLGSLALRAKVLRFVDSRCVTAKNLGLAALASTAVNALGLFSLFSLLRLSISSSTNVKVGN